MTKGFSIEDRASACDGARRYAGLAVIPERSRRSTRWRDSNCNASEWCGHSSPLHTVRVESRQRQATDGATLATLPFPKSNNLDWLRLAFATQVVLVHASEHLRLGIPPEAGKRSNGVPGFFFVSGFLIYASYLNTTPIRFLQNRCLRLYPGLIFVTLGGACVTLMAHGWSALLSDRKDICHLARGTNHIRPSLQSKSVS